MQQRNIIILALICILALSWTACGAPNRLGCPVNQKTPHTGY